MPERYKGQIKSIGAAELGASGHEKPRKVVISDSPTYQGKTFRIWSNDSDFDTLMAASNAGREVEIEYVVEERQGGPSGTYKQNMIVNVHDPRAGDWSVPQPSEGEAPPPGDGFSVPASASPEPQSPPPSDPWEDKTYEIEAAWAVKAVLDARPELLNNFGDLMLQSKKLIEEKRRLALQLKNSPGGTPASTPQTKLAEKSPGADVAEGGAQAVPSTPTDGGSPPHAFTVIATAIGEGKVTQAAAIAATARSAPKHNYFPSKGIGWNEVESAPEPVLVDAASLLGLDMEMASV